MQPMHFWQFLALQWSKQRLCWRACTKKNSRVGCRDSCRPYLRTKTNNSMHLGCPYPRYVARKLRSTVLSETWDSSNVECGKTIPTCWKAQSARKGRKRRKRAIQRSSICARFVWCIWSHFQLGLANTSCHSQAKVNPGCSSLSSRCKYDRLFCECSWWKSQRLRQNWRLGLGDVPLQLGANIERKGRKGARSSKRSSTSCRSRCWKSCRRFAKAKGNRWSGAWSRSRCFASYWCWRYPQRCCHRSSWASPCSSSGDCTNSWSWSDFARRCWAPHKKPGPCFGCNSFLADGHC